MPYEVSWRDSETTIELMAPYDMESPFLFYTYEDKN